MEENGLINRIEAVKAKISEFEKSLNITAIDLDKITVSGEKDIINQISDYKKRINVIENEVLKSKEESYSMETEPSLPSIKADNTVIQKQVEQSENKDQEINSTLMKVKKDAIEVENISSMLDRLKENINAVKSNGFNSNDKAIQKPNIVHQMDNTAVKADQASKINVEKPVQMDIAKQVAVNTGVKLTENDLNSISELISKLDELLRSNKYLSDKLNELIQEQRRSNANANTSRTNELINKLAYFGLNRN